MIKMRIKPTYPMSSDLSNNRKDRPRTPNNVRNRHSEAVRPSFKEILVESIKKLKEYR